MDEALQPLVEMNTLVWKGFKRTLTELHPDEIDWRPLPQANNMNVIVRHLRLEAEWHLDCLERGAPMPTEVTQEAQRRIDSVGMDFDRNLRELEELYTRFVVQLGKMAPDDLKKQSALAYRSFRDELPAHTLGFHQAIHLAGHMGQISSIRNLYQKARGQPARFFPDNPTYPK
ncbi:MAG: DUF664 domain-containing protein [Candidatus Acidiferrales bacterium]